MAGQVYGKIECKSANIGSGTIYAHQNAQEVFKGLYDFLTYLETQNVVTLRARFAGQGASSAAATDYWDGAAPFTVGAWFLFEWRTSTTTPANPSYAGTRVHPMYILVQLVSQSATMTGNAAPALFNSVSTYQDGAVAIQMAVGVGGSMMPWAGTLGTYGTPASFGSQAKGNPVWQVPPGGQGLYVFPRSNNAGGSHATIKQNLNVFMDCVYSSSVITRYSFIADHDGLFVIGDQGNDQLNRFLYQGVYKLRSNLVATQDPYIQIGGQSYVLNAGNNFGDLIGSAVLNGGIAFNTYGTYDVRIGIVSMLQEVLGYNTNSMQPNKLFATPTFDEMPVLVGVKEYYEGYAGAIDFFRIVQNTTNNDRNTAGTRHFIGQPAVAQYKLSIPWNSAVVPLSGTTRTGTTGAFP